MPCSYCGGCRLVAETSNGAFVPFVPALVGKADYSGGLHDCPACVVNNRPRPDLKEFAFTA